MNTCVPSTHWSCGDGQCIPQFSRHIYQKLLPHDEPCKTMREFYHMCESNSYPSFKLWTKPNGLCWFSEDAKYNDSAIDMENINVLGQ